MPLTICNTPDERLVSGPAEVVLRRALSSRGRATLLVPSYARQLEACEQLACLGGLSLGVTVTTPESWIEERWQVWGDGTRVIDGSARMVALDMVLEGNTSGVRANPGTVGVLARLASGALPWLPRNPEGRIDRTALLAEGLTKSEASVVCLLGTYERFIGQMGFVEGSTAANKVVGRVIGGGAGGSLWPVVAVGFGAVDRLRRELLASLATATDVTLVSAAGNAAADEARDASFALLEGMCARMGVTVSRVSAGGSVALGRAPELDDVLRGIFGGGPTGIHGGGAVSLVLPAGSLAEAEAVAREAERLATQGDQDIVVATADPSRAWRELSPKLASRGLSVEAELVERFDGLDAGRAFLEFAQAVARLSDLAASWPAPLETEEGTLVRLGDMGWWPPRDVTDFLLSDLAHMDRRRVQALDRRWRSDRLLTPEAVLDTLRNPGQTSQEVAGATSELLKGRLGSAASRLLAPYAREGGAEVPVGGFPPGSADPLADERAAKALEAVMNVGRTLRDLDITADPRAEGQVPLVELVRRAGQVLASSSVVVRPQVPAGDGRVRVRILSFARAAGLPPASADGVIVCNQTSAEAPIGTGDDVTSALLQTLGIEPEVRPVAQARADLWGLLAVARRHVSVERVLFDADSREAYPSVMLTELLACYGAEDGSGRPPQERGLSVCTLSETPAARGLSAAGEDPTPVASELPAAAGAVTGAARALINVPREGMAGLQDGRPVLSASQIETYLECPYKWFSLRRLRLEDCDVGFAPVQMGTFAHRVLEVTHSTLLADGLADMAARGEVVPDVAAHPETRVPGSRVTSDDPVGIAHAKELLAEELEAHTRHMFLRRRREDTRNALVPHTAQDEGLLHTLRRDLEDVIDYEAGMLDGFEPRLFEWDFGRREPEPYAGAWIRGTVDRVDVSAHGGAVVIDYKHRRGSGLMGEYAALAGEEGDFVLPRHVQALMYGQVVRRHFPGLHVQGAIYLTTAGLTHNLSGAVEEDQVDNVYGSHRPTKKALQGVAVPRDATFGTADSRGMEALLDATEDAVAQAIARMLAGDIEANPVDARACDWCPVMNCERRIDR